VCVKVKNMKLSIPVTLLIASVTLSAMAQSANLAFPVATRGQVELECTIDTVLRYTSTPRAAEDRTIARFRIDFTRKRIGYGRLSDGQWVFTISGQSGTDWSPTQPGRSLQGDIFVIARTQDQFIGIDLNSGNYIQTDRHPLLKQLSPYGRFGFCTVIANRF
jgi:hypothetical protein